MSKQKEAQSDNELGDIENLLGLSEGDNSDLVIVLKDLSDLEHNIEAKTELDKGEIKQLMLMGFWGEEIKPYSSIAYKFTVYWIDKYPKWKISFKRRGRKEIIQALMNRDKMDDEHREIMKRILH